MCFSELTEFQTREETGERDFAVQVIEIYGIYITTLAKFPFESSSDFNRSMQIFFLSLCVMLDS